MAEMFSELSGNHVVEGRITIPGRGLWHADVTLDKEVPTLAAAGLILLVADLRLTCAVYRKPIPYQGKTRVRLIGGAGGWRKEIPEKGYKLATGVRLGLLLADAARECGERITLADDRILGFHYSRDRAPAMRLLNRWLADEWWIDADGMTRTGPRPASLVASPFSLLGYDGARGVATVATEKPGDFLPGRTFRAPTMAATLTVGGVTHSITKGALRTEVLAA